MKRRRYSALLTVTLMTLFFLVACSNNQTPQSGASATPLKPVEEDAQKLYLTRCQPCHGVDGKGVEKIRAKNSRLPDFTDAEWQKTKPDDILAHSIAEGVGTGQMAMPRWKTMFTPNQINDLVAHVRTYAKK